MYIHTLRYEIGDIFIKVSQTNIQASNHKEVEIMTDGLKIYKFLLVLFFILKNKNC